MKEWCICFMNISGETKVLCEMRTAKLFKNGKNQAVRLPKQFEFEGIDEVIIKKEGDKIVLIPIRKTWLSYADLPLADDDFMLTRPSLMDDDERVSF
jgi:antitoxin VapB